VIAEFGGRLRAAGFDGNGVRDALAAEGPTISRSTDRVVHVRRLAGRGALGSLVRLFVLDLPLTVAEAAEALTPAGLEQAAELAFVTADDGEVRPLVRIVPHDDLLVVSDLRLLPSEQAASDHVAGVHAPSLTLSHLTVRRPVAKALDMGTGNGIQAILASRHAKHVVATDVNPRALEFARMNAALNGADAIEFREGTFFEPAAGELFDLVVSNPPYVISPETEYLFRDSGLPGDSVSRGAVQEVPSVLAEGGFATLLVSWVHEPGESWARPLREWLDDSGCDAWLLHYKTEDPLDHTASWNRDAAEGDDEAFDAVIERWLDYLGRLGIEAIATGAVILRKRSSGSPNWIREDELPTDRLSPASDHIMRVFAAQDFLASGADILEERLALAPRTRLEQSVVLRDGIWTVDGIAVGLQEGLGFRAGVDSPTSQLLAQLDGKRTLAEIAGGLAQAARPVVEQLLAAGFLVRS
jgi:hypothetical protein